MNRVALLLVVGLVAVSCSDQTTADAQERCGDTVSAAMKNVMTAIWSTKMHAPTRASLLYVVMGSFALI